jgi:pimeloyl-ACP methyl ester carboxylesterase
MRRFILLFLLVLVGSLHAYAQEMRILRTPEERFANLPGYAFAPHYVEVERGLRMHYVDEGARDAAPVLLLHGQPSWSYLYRKMIPVLVKAGQRVIAPDLIGYGRSDKPAATSDYSYAKHVAWLTTLVEKLELNHTTMVVHDWGGLLGLRVLTAQPQRFARLVVLNTSLNTGGEWETFTPQYRTGYENWRNYLLTTKNLKFAPVIQRQSATQLTPEIAAAYDAPYPDDSFTQGARMMTSLIPVKPDMPGVAENLKAEAALKQWKKPVLLAFSEDSERVHPGQHKRFRELFPQDAIWRDVTVVGTKHFLQEDKGEELAALVNEFINVTRATQAKQTSKVAEGQLPVETVDELILKDQKRNKELLLKIYFPKTGDNHPVIVFSHGAGASKDNYEPVGRFWASHGYVVIHPTHADSIALRRKQGETTDVRELLRVVTSDPQAWANRPRDVSFVLDSLSEIERRAPQLKGKLNHKIIGVGGHSFGAYTTQLIGGATVDLPQQPTGQSFADKRAQALVVLSGQGRNQQGLTETSWQNVKLPLLNVTGSLDRGAGGQGAEWKQEPYNFSPPGDKYQLFLEGAEHGLGGISGARQAAARENPEQLAAIKTVTLAFWNAYLKQDKASRAFLQSEQPREPNPALIKWSRK